MSFLTKGVEHGDPMTIIPYSRSRRGRSSSKPGWATMQGPVSKKKKKKIEEGNFINFNFTHTLGSEVKMEED
jgi:hypothetical protein